jgi:hypothetical protein
VDNPSSEESALRIRVRKLIHVSNNDLKDEPVDAIAFSIQRIVAGWVDQALRQSEEEFPDEVAAEAFAFARKIVDDEILEQESRSHVLKVAMRMLETVEASEEARLYSLEYSLACDEVANQDRSPRVAALEKRRELGSAAVALRNVTERVLHDLPEDIRRFALYRLLDTVRETEYANLRNRKPWLSVGEAVSVSDVVSGAVRDFLSRVPRD